MHFPDAILILIVATLTSLAATIASARFRLPLALMTVILAACVAGAIHLLFAGSVILFDPTGRAAKAAFFNRDHSVEMSRLPGGLYYGEPPGDFSARVTCVDGRIVEFGYFTPGMPSFERLEGETGC